MSTWTGNPVFISTPAIVPFRFSTLKAIPYSRINVSEVRSPTLIRSSFFMKFAKAATRASPPIRSDRDSTTRPSESIAISVVPAPTSITKHPRGSEKFNPAPIAAATGS